jgi:hypothetical protein
VARRSADDPLAGISTKSTKKDMMARLEELADRVRGKSKPQAASDPLADLKKRLKAKPLPGQGAKVQFVMAGLSESELDEAEAFLQELDGFSPTGIQRFHEGVKALIAANAKTTRR